MIGGSEEFGCRSDAFRCRVAQALTLRAKTHCRGSDVSYYEVFAKLGLTGFDSFGAPIYNATSVSFSYEGKAVHEDYGELVHTTAMCSASSFYLPEDFGGLSLHYDFHPCGAGKPGWVIDFPLFDPREERQCAAVAAEFDTPFFASPPQGKTNWDARTPFFCDGQPMGGDPLWKHQPRGHATIDIEPIDAEDLIKTPCTRRRLSWGQWTESQALQAEVDKIGHIFAQCA